MPTRSAVTSRPQISRVPYLPGLDGMRAVAVVAVMIYHANNSWLHGGFLGVEVFFVISGYLITLLMIAEHERSGRVALGQFWLRRARRLLPALFVMLAGLAIYTAIFYRRAQGSVRGDFVAAIAYVSNWFQIWVGAGYTAGEDFAPLRHLWSLAVEEQFYLLWPLAMVAILRLGRDRLPLVGAWLAGISVAITVAMAVLYRAGDVAITCTGNSNGYATIAGRCISVNDGLYLGTLSRAGGLLLGAAFATVWRPLAVIRGPLREKGPLLDLLALVGVAGLAVLMWHTHVVQSGVNFGTRYDPWLFRGGFLLTGIATIFVIAAVTHAYALSGKVFGNPVFNWIGTRSYGLYLFHWPIYQAIRKHAGIELTPAQFALAMVITLPVTEVSYRFVETPIRQGRLGEWLHRERRPRTAAAMLRRRRAMLAGSAALGAVAIAGVSIAIAPTQCVGTVECQIQAAEDATTSPGTTVASVATVPLSTQPGETAPATAAPTTIATTTSTTLPIDQRPVVAFGESVMLGAKKVLQDRGMTVIAAEAKQGQWILDQLRAERTAGHIGRTVVIQTGTNGTVEDFFLDAIMKELPQDQTNLVIFMTVKADQPWIATNNALIRAMSRYPNVKVVDWEAMANQRPDLLASDGVHLKNQSAYDYYANAITSVWTSG